MTATPKIGIFLTIYLITLALYPPFPNSLYYLNIILNSNIDIFENIIMVILFFLNFILSMKIMKETLFGKPNKTIHYVDFDLRDEAIHILVVVGLIILSLFGLREVLL